MEALDKESSKLKEKVGEPMTGRGDFDVIFH